MKSKVEPERYFVINDFEDGWGMDDIQCEEQLLIYCTEALFIPEELIEELNINDSYNLEIFLSNIDLETVNEDWYVNLMKISKDRF